MINGLQLTIPGEEVRQLLEQRMEDHRRRADWWKRQQARTPEEQAEDEPLMPEHICANEAERHEWRVAVLEFIRDRIESAEVYRLDETDLRFGELLPAKPGWLEQEEYEERTSAGFHLERLSKNVGEYRRENGPLTRGKLSETHAEIARFATEGSEVQNV